MKRLIFVAATVVALAAECAGLFDNAWLRGVTDKDPLTYSPEEKITFTVTLQGLQGEVPTGYALKWRRTGDDGVCEYGSVPFTSAPFVYSTRLGKPGFVRLYAEVVGPDGKVCRSAKNNVFFDGGAGAAVDALAPRQEPADFDQFWAREKARLAELPMDARRVELPPTVEGMRLYAVSVPCLGPRPVTGYLLVPNAVDSGARFPARLETYGYGFNKTPGRPRGVRSKEEVFLSINAHGMPLEPLGGDWEAEANALERLAYANHKNYAFSEKENARPETSYFYGMAMRVMRALQYLKTVEGWNGKDLISCGGSQGGLQAIWAAGCGEGVTRVESTITWCCDLGGELEGRNRGDWFIRWADGLGYYDAVNWAKRIPATCMTVIPRAGLGDYVCPPSGLARLWNAVKGPKKITWVQGSQHGYVPPAYEGRDFVRESR